MKKKQVILILILLASMRISAQLHLPPIINDHMVLQQEAEVQLWGKSTPGENIKITPTWDGKEYVTKVDNQGDWKVCILTPKAGGPFQIRIEVERESRVLNNVMLGEVWLCGGQSNMDISFKGLSNQPIFNAIDELLDSNYPQLRLFRVKRAYSLTPMEECQGKWEVASPESAVGFSAVGFLFGRLLHQREKMPVGVITCAWGGSSVEAWMSRENVLRFVGVEIPNETDNKRANETPTALFNAMLKPLTNYSIRGCLFYQGEANITEPDAYRERFPAMVKEWQKLWGKEFPFFYAQLAPYSYKVINWESEERQGARFREVQKECLVDIPNGEMIATSDIGASHTIHPGDKQTIAKRFYYLAANRCYGHKHFECIGPTYKTMQINDNRVAISFSHAPYGISSNGEEIVGFEVAGIDHRFYPAKARLKGRSIVEVCSDSVENPVAVRYCFTNYSKANLYNNFGLPAYPFRTDEWIDWK